MKEDCRRRNVSSDSKELLTKLKSIECVRNSREITSNQNVKFDENEDTRDLMEAFAPYGRMYSF